MEYHQRNLFKLMTELRDLEWDDKEVWQLCFDTIGRKKRINNMTFFHYFNDCMRHFNSEPSSPFFKTLQPNIDALEKHMNQNRSWRYDFNEARMYTHQELIDRRDNIKIDD